MLQLEFKHYVIEVSEKNKIIQNLEIKFVKK